MAKRQRKGKPTKPKSLNNPHDKWFKTSFSMRPVIEGYLTEVFPKKYGEKLDLATLELDNNSYMSQDMEETTSDLVWRCRLKTGRMVMLSFLFEHKSYRPKRPHLQVGVYQFGAYVMQDRTNPSIPLVQVVPIMVYHGLEGWAFVEPFETYFGEIDADFMRFLPCFDFIFDNIHSYPDEVIKAFELRFLEKIFLAFKNYRDEVFIKNHFAELWLLNYKNYENDETDFFIHAFGVYLSAVIGEMPLEKIDEQLNKNPKAMVSTERFLDRYRKQGLQEGRQKGRQEGRQEGHQEGLQEGRQEERERTVLNIYRRKGWSAIEIADFLEDYSIEFVQSIIDKFEKNGEQENQN